MNLENNTKILKKRNEILYLMTHSKHFYLRLHGVGHLVNDHSDSKTGNPLPPHGLFFSISSIPQTG